MISKVQSRLCRIGSIRGLAVTTLPPPWKQEQSSKSIPISRKRPGFKSKNSSKNNKKERELPPRFTLGSGVISLTAENLLGLVRSTAPYIFTFSDNNGKISQEDEDSNDSTLSAQEDVDNQRVIHEEAMLSTIAKGPGGWRNILVSPGAMLQPTSYPTDQQRIDYFTLCLAAHFATVASYVPTDVDSKIRGHCWDDPSLEVLHAQLEVVKAALTWDVYAVSQKALRLINSKGDEVTVSGHDGELLGVMSGAWGGFLRKGDNRGANFLEVAIGQELQREANLFKQYRLAKSSVENDTALLKLAAIMTHNVGDVDQGLSSWGGAVYKHEAKFHLFARLAHQRGDRFGGEFIRAKEIYKALVSAEGHRNYPLREARGLRRDLDLALPLGPWYEDWGRRVATHKSLSHDDRMLVVRQLLRGCDSTSRVWCVPNQVGYYRALQGIGSCIDLVALTADLDDDARRTLEIEVVQEHLSISQDAFAESLSLKTRNLLGTLQ